VHYSTGGAYPQSTDRGSFSCVAAFSIEKSASGHPLSFSQQQLWLVHQLEPNNLAYNIPIAIHLKGELNVTALEQSLNEIIIATKSCGQILELWTVNPCKRSRPHLA
jgi:hypothetical protein